MASIGFSCTTKDTAEEVPAGGGTEAVISAGISNNTRAEDNHWDPNDEIGLAMLVRNGTEIIDDIFNYEYYTPTGGKAFIPFSSASRVFFPMDGRSVSFRAYYPYYPDMTGNMVLPVSIADQTVLPDIDLMSAEHISGFSKDDPNVELRFHHRLSKIIFNFNVQDGIYDPNSIDVNIKGMLGSGTYDLLGEKLTVDGNSGGDIALRNAKPGENKYGIVMPRPAGQGVVFEFTTPDGVTFTAPMDGSMELRPGYKYIFTVNVLKTEVEISAEIEDWIEGPESNYSVLQVSEEAGDSEGAAAGDVMDVYMESGPGVYDLLRKFTYDINGKWVPETPVYWEDIEQDPVRLRASIVRGTAYPTQLADILVSGETDVARNRAAHFTFRHSAAKVLVRLNSTTFSRGDLAGADIVLPGYETGGTLQDGAFVPGTSRGDINLDRSDMDNSYALIQPQTVASGSPLMYITINGRRYEVEADNAGLTYEAGFVTIINVKIEKEGVSFSVTVEDWNYLPPLNLGILEIGTAVDGAEGVLDGEELKVYRGNDTDRTYMTTYTYSSAGDTWTPAETIYWEDLPDNFTVYGSILRHAKYEASQLDDYLVAEPKAVQAADGVHLDLEHAGAMVVVKLRSSDNSFSAAELAAMEMMLPGYMTGGNVVDGLFVPGTGTGNINIAKNVGDYSNSAIAIIQPQYIAAGNTVIRMTAPGGRTYDAEYNAGIVYNANEATVLEVDMKKTGLTVSANVVDWEEGLTIVMAVRAITVEGTNLSTDIFFENQSIEIYKVGPPTETYSYEYIQQGSSWVWSGEPVYWDDQSVLPLNLGAVYFPLQGLRPTVGGNDTSFPWNLPAYQKDGYANYDIMMGYVSLNRPEYVNFMFRHPLSKVRVLLEGVDFTPEELTGATVMLNNFILGGTALLGSAQVQAAAGPETDVTPHTDTDGYEYSAIVMPQEMAQGTTVVTVTLPGYPGNPFPGKLEQDLTFEPGKVHTIRVRLLKTKIELSATLEPWTDGQEGSVTID